MRATLVAEKGLMMLAHQKEILCAVLETIRAHYADDVSILFIYGSCVNGTANAQSDLDMIFVPKTEKGWQLAKTFLYQGTGNDLW
ncbi:MAG: hypothetical protein PHO66_07560, partial [Eubacteriales bacterium]|nr:hypothetical protein [Eubacteriales bacterium]